METPQQIAHKKWSIKGMSKKYAVYVLPKSDYIGYTTQFNQRLAKHKSLGRNIEFAHIVYETDSKEDAKRTEAFLQSSKEFKGSTAGGSNHRHIYWSKTNKNYRVQLTVNGVEKCIGCRKDLQDAIDLRDEFYKLNN